MQIDTDGEAMTSAEIEKMAHTFLAKRGVDKIDVSHNQVESGCIVVESFIARKNDPDGFLEGSWVLGVYVPNDEQWEAIKKGDLNGFSFQGGVHKEKVRAVVTTTKQMVGETEKSAEGLLPPHNHQLNLFFGMEGKILSGVTSEELSHFHEVLKATATEEAMEHSHRLVLIENEEV